MKKINSLEVVCLSLLMAGVGLTITACSSDDDKSESGTLIMQMECSTTVTDFLDDVLPLNANDHLAMGFFTIPEFTRNDVCYVINSMDELRSVYNEEYGPCLPELDIDFSKSTLIVGQARITSENTLPGKKLRQTLYDDTGHYVLYLDYESVDKKLVVEVTDPRLVYYWGIYPKLNNKEVIIKVTLK